MKILKKILKWSLITFIVWLTCQGLVYGYWLSRAWNDSNLAEDIDKQMETLPSDVLFKKVASFNLMIVDPYRDSAWGILIDRKDKRVVSILIKRLKSWNRQTRVGAMRALGDIGDKRSIKPLMDIVKKSKIDYNYDGAETPDYIVALEALARMRYEPAYKYAVEITTKEEPNNFKGYGVIMLGYFEKPEALPILKRILEEEKDLSWARKSNTEEAIQRIESAQKK
ncbi:MAG: HEAT repeat domain-containing protein [Candidatus Omnitrophota bacterium]